MDATEELLDQFPKENILVEFSDECVEKNPENIARSFKKGNCALVFRSPRLLQELLMEISLGVNSLDSFRSSS